MIIFTPFNKKIPIPFIVKDNLRIPTLPYLLLDNFKMSLINLDLLTGVDPNNQPDIDRLKNKISRYWLKVAKMFDLLKNKNSKELLNQLNRAMKHTFELYQPLSFTNAICFRLNNAIYIKKLQEKPECSPEYVQKLADFRSAYLNVANIISKLNA